MENKKKETESQPIDKVLTLLENYSPKEYHVLLKMWLSETEKVANQNHRCLFFLGIIIGNILHAEKDRHESLIELMRKGHHSAIDSTGEHFSKSLDYSYHVGNILFFLIHELACILGISDEKWQQLMNKTEKYSEGEMEVASLEELFKKPSKPEKGKEPSQ